MYKVENLKQVIQSFPFIYLDFNFIESLELGSF